MATTIPTVLPKKCTQTGRRCRSRKWPCFCSLVQKGLAGTTVAQAASAVSWAMQIADIPDCTKHRMVQQVIAAARRIPRDIKGANPNGIEHLEMVRKWAEDKGTFTSSRTFAISLTLLQLFRVQRSSTAQEEDGVHGWRLHGIPHGKTEEQPVPKRHPFQTDVHLQEPRAMPSQALQGMDGPSRVHQGRRGAHLPVYHRQMGTGQEVLLPGQSEGSSESFQTVQNLSALTSGWIRFAR